MANLGTLTLDLVAKTGNFVQGMDKAGRSAKKTTDQIAKGAKVAAGAVTALATVTAAATIAMINNYRGIIDENAKTARSLETTYAAFVTIKEAAGEAGVGMSTVESASRTLNRELGKALAGSQKQIEAFKRLKLSAEEVAKLPLDERIATINKALIDNIDVNQRAAAAAELFGSKNGAAMQMLNADGIASAAEQLDLFGLRLSEVDAVKVESANDAMARFGLLADGIGTQLTVELAPVLQAIADLFMDSAREAGGMGNAVQDSVGTAVKALAFMADAADGVKRVFTLAADAIIIIINRIAYAASQAVVVALKILDTMPGIDMSKQLESVKEFSATAKGVMKEAAANMSETLDKPLAGEKLLAFYAQAQKDGQAAAEAAVANAAANRKTGEVYETAAKNGTKAVKAQRDAVGDLIKNLQLNAEMVGLNKDEQVLFKLSLDGATESQIAQAKAALDTVSAFDAAKKSTEDYKSLVSGLRTEEEKRTDTLREQLAVIQAVQGVSQGDKDQAAGRAVQDATKGDRPEFGGNDSNLGELFRIGNAEKDLNKWYASQLEMLDSFREEFAEKSEEWDEAELEAKRYHIEQLQEIDAARRDVLLATTEQMFGNAAALTKQFAGENSAAYKAMFIAEKTAGMARAAVAVATGIAQAAANPWPLNLAAIASTIAATAGLVANVSAIGMAHDGIDSVPKTGTWILEKGERVITNKTSAKLDGMLESASRGGMGGGSQVNQTIMVQGQVDNYTASQIARKTAQQQSLASARLG